jgi:hypothetical protein
MSIEQNIAERKAAQQLFDSMLAVAREDFLKLSDRSKRLFWEIAFEHFAKRLGKPIDASTPIPKPALPVAKELSTDAKYAIRDLEHLITLCDDVPSAGQSFASDVAESAGNMMDTINEMGFVTDKQIISIENWTNGVSRWLR